MGWWTSPRGLKQKGKWKHKKKQRRKIDTHSSLCWPARLRHSTMVMALGCCMPLRSKGTVDVSCHSDILNATLCSFLWLSSDLELIHNCQIPFCNLIPGCHLFCSLETLTYVNSCHLNVTKYTFASYLQCEMCLTLFLWWSSWLINSIVWLWCCVPGRFARLAHSLGSSVS